MLKEENTVTVNPTVILFIKQDDIEKGRREKKKKAVFDSMKGKKRKIR